MLGLGGGCPLVESCEDTGVQKSTDGGLFHCNTPFNTAMEPEGTAPTLTRVSGSAVVCEHIHLGGGQMEQRTCKHGGAATPDFQPGTNLTQDLLTINKGLVGKELDRGGSGVILYPARFLAGDIPGRRRAKHVGSDRRSHTH